MALISEGIENVRAIEVPAGIWKDGDSVALPRVVLVRWHCDWIDKLYQVYVNGQYAGATVEPGQREMIVQLPSSCQLPVRMEVFAVQAGEADIDFSEELYSAIAQSGRVKITLLRSQELSIGSTVQIYFDNGTGEIDYDNPLNDMPIRVWPERQDKAGFGMSRFGFSDFGRDWSAGVGFGRGSLGNGEFGVDADTLEWISEPMQAGIYKFAVKVTDERGNESGVSETEEVAVILPAKPAEHLDVYSFDKNTNNLVLSVS